MSGCSKTVTHFVQLIGVNVCSQKKKWPNNHSRTHSTPHTNLNYVNARRKRGKTVILEVYISSEFKPNVTAKQNDCGVYLSTIRSIQSLVHKMQSRMTICAAELANHDCLICMLYACTFSVFACSLEWNIVP